MNRLDVRLTAQGRRELEQELAGLEAERPVISARLGEARAGGNDPAENLDLRDAMDALAMLEGRIGELRALLAAAEPLEEGRAADGKVHLGSKVHVKHGDGEEATYTLVSPAEADPRRGRISLESPIGRVLLGSQKGQNLSAQAPGGAQRLVVLDIE